MAKSIWRWTGWFVFLFVLDFTVPFLFLKSIPSVSGSFLFWLVWIIVAVISMFLILWRWEDKEL